MEVSQGSQVTALSEDGLESTTEIITSGRNHVMIESNGWAGINLIELTKLGSYAPYNTTPVASGRTISSTYVSADTTERRYFTLQVIGFKKVVSETYTISGYMKINGTPAKNEDWVTKTADTNNTTVLKFYVNDNTGRFEITETTRAESVWLLHAELLVVVGDVVRIEDLKFEKGFSATEWTPSPGDEPLKIEPNIRRVKVSGHGETEKHINITFAEACIPEHPFYIKWINSVSGWGYKMFHTTQQATEKTTKVGVFEPYQNSFSREDLRDSFLNVVHAQRPHTAEHTEIRSIGTDWDDPRELLRLNEILTSPCVLWWNEEAHKWVQIIIDKQSLKYDTDAVFGEFEIQVTMPNRDLQF